MRHCDVGRTFADQGVGEEEARCENNERFRGKRVLIVGMAESGADIVREIGDVADACTNHTWFSSETPAASLGGG